MPFPVDNIRRGCKAKGITLAELERITGIGNGVIARWENAKTAPPVDRIMQISFVLDIPLGELCGTENPAGTIADGVDEKITALSPELRELFVRFLELAKANPEKAARYLSFAVQELQVQQ